MRARSTTLSFALLTLALLFVPAEDAYAQETRASTFLFQGITPYPSVYALGGATVAADGALGSPDVNPATIGESGYVTGSTALSTGDAGLFGSAWLPGSGFTDGVAFYTPRVTVRRGPWAGSVHLKYFDLATVSTIGRDGLEEGTYDSSEYRLGVSGAYAVNRIVRVGAGLNLVNASLGPDTGVTTMNLDLGVHAKWPVDLSAATLTPMVGASLIGFGPTVSYGGLDDSEEAQTMPFRVGAGARLASTDAWRPGRPFWQASLFASLRKDLNGGEFSQAADGSRSFDAYGPFAALVKTWDGVDGAAGMEPVSAMEQISRHVGLSVTGLGILSLRYGARFSPSRVTPRAYSAVGVGLDLYYVRLDYSTSVNTDAPFDAVEYLRITGRIPLNANDPANFWRSL